MIYLRVLVFQKLLYALMSDPGMIFQILFVDSIFDRCRNTPIYPERDPVLSSGYDALSAGDHAINRFLTHMFNTETGPHDQGPAVLRQSWRGSFSASVVICIVSLAFVICTLSYRHS